MWQSLCSLLMEKPNPEVCDATTAATSTTARFPKKIQLRNQNLLIGLTEYPPVFTCTKREPSLKFISHALVASDSDEVQ